MTMKFRAYDPDKDVEAAHRIWHEVGWIEKDERKEEAMDILVGCSRALVTEVNGEAECLVLTSPGTIRYRAIRMALLKSDSVPSEWPFLKSDGWTETFRFRLSPASPPAASRAITL